MSVDVWTRICQNASLCSGLKPNLIKKSWTDFSVSGFIVYLYGRQICAYLNFFYLFGPFFVDIGYEAWYRDPENQTDHHNGSHDVVFEEF